MEVLGLPGFSMDFSGRLIVPPGLGGRVCGVGVGGYLWG